MFSGVFTAVLIVYIGSIVNFTDASEVQEYKEMLTYLLNVPEVKVDAEIANFTFRDLLKMQKLLSIKEKMAHSTEQQIIVGECVIRHNELSCNGERLHSSEYYTNGKDLVQKVCPYIRTLVLDDTNTNVGDSELDDCVKAAESDLENLSIKMPENSSLNAEYVEFLTRAGRKFPKLNALSVVGWTGGILNIDTLCPETPLQLLTLNKCNMDNIEWQTPPVLLEVDGSECTNFSKFLALVSEKKPLRQAWVKPPQKIGDIIHVKNLNELSISGGGKFFYFNRVPFNLAGNTENVITTFKSLDVDACEHLLIDNLTHPIDMSDLQSDNKKIIHLTILTTFEVFFESLEQNYKEFSEIIEYGLIPTNETTQQLTKYIYIDFMLQFVDLTENCYDLFIENMKIKYLTVTSNTSVDPNARKALIDELDKRNELEFLKINVNKQDLLKVPRPKTFKRFTHISNEKFDIISKEHAGYKCAELILKSRNYSGAQMEDVTEAIIADGEYYGILFETFFYKPCSADLISIMSRLKECKILEISGTSAGAKFFKYMTENEETVRDAFSGLRNLKYIRINVDEVVRSLDILGRVIPSATFIVLKFKPQTGIVDKDVDTLLERFNGERFQKLSKSDELYVPEKDQICEKQIDDDDQSDDQTEWFRSTEFDNPIIRTYVFSREIEMNHSEITEIKNLIEKSWSLLELSNETIASKKKSNEKIQKLRTATI